MDAASAQTFSQQLDPRASFHRIGPNDSAVQPLVVTLAAIGAGPGATIEMSTTGFFSNTSSPPDTARDAFAIFSGNGVVNSNQSLLDRVERPIPAGPSADCGVTFPDPVVGSLPKDIPQDFMFSRTGWSGSIRIKVPSGATHLVIGASDSHFSTNSDWNNDFMVHIDVVAPAPEMPGTGEHIMLMGRESGQQFTTVDRRQVSPTAPMIDVMVSCPTGVPNSGTPVLVFGQLVPVAYSPAQALPGYWLSTGILIGGFAYNGQATWGPSVSIGLDPILHYLLQGSSLLFQAGALDPEWSRNGIYQTTYGLRFDF